MFYFCFFFNLALILQYLDKRKGSWLVLGMPFSLTPKAYPNMHLAFQPVLMFRVLLPCTIGKAWQDFLR